MATYMHACKQRRFIGVFFFPFWRRAEKEISLPRWGFARATAAVLGILNHCSWEAWHFPTSEVCVCTATIALMNSFFFVVLFLFGSFA